MSPIWSTPAGFLGTATELTVSSFSVTATGALSYTVISGSLPSGTSLSATTGSITGTPYAVINNTRSTFVVRASNADGIADRTFSIDIAGPNAPQWVTTSGYLTVGISGEPYAMNNQWVNFQLVASTVNAPADTKLTYYIGNNDGVLPPGLLLSSTGTISGFVTDQLTFDGLQSPLGGYDEESYDNYSYDHYADSTSTSVGIPKIYNFRVSATDGVLSTSSIFKIAVVNPFMVRNPSAVNLSSISSILQTNTNYIPPVQFIKGNDLGVIRASNNEDINIGAYDSYPILGSVVYSISSTTDISTQLPPDLQLDPNTGYIYGFVPYQPAYTKNYTLTIVATKSYFTATVTTTNVFSLAVKGEIESSIEWVTSPDLGSFEVGQTSELAVVAKQLNSTYSIKYRQISGTLPAGLTLERDGTLSGSISTGTAGVYTFGIEASDVYGLSAISRTFTLNVTQTDNKSYTKIYVKPFLSVYLRSAYQDFITNEFTFDPNLMYRYFDPNFGIQNNIKMYLEFGIESVNLREYTTALRENFYRKKLYFGDVKVAVAKDSSGNPVYEVVYVDVVDDQVNSQGNSAPRIVYSDNEIFYPGSVNNMRTGLELIVLPDYSYIEINDNYLPKFMQTAQSGSYNPPGYMRVIPLCYALPGNGSKIVSRIKLSGFDFKMLDFEVDRLIVENSADSTSAKYLIFERQSISDHIPEDDILYGPDDVEINFSEDYTQ
jgi:Putative Ig domain